jgi:hypothetical protein
MPRIVTPDVEDFIALKAGSGLSSRAISALLLSEMGVTLSFKGVSKEMSRRRAERSEVARAVVREKLGRTLLSDLDRLERIRKSVAARANRVKDHYTESGKPEWIMLKELEVKILDRKIHYSGADDPDGPGVLNGPTIMIPPESDD